MASFVLTHSLRTLTPTAARKKKAMVVKLREPNCTYLHNAHQVVDIAVDALGHSRVLYLDGHLLSVVKCGQVHLSWENGILIVLLFWGVY